MEDRHISSYKFANDVRSNLRFQHGYEHGTLEKMNGIFEDGLKHVGSSSLTTYNYEKAAKFMRKEHPEGRNLSSRDWERFDSALKSHLGMGDTKH